MLFFTAHNFVGLLSTPQFSLMLTFVTHVYPTRSLYVVILQKPYFSGGCDGFHLDTLLVRSVFDRVTSDATTFSNVT